MSHEYAIGDLDRRIANMIRVGKVKEVDLSNAVAKVEIGDITTPWIPWGVDSAGKNRRWRAPDVDEQVVVFSPGGDFAQGVIGPSLYQDDFTPNGDEDTIERITFEDGSVVEYDTDAQELNLTLDDDAKLTVTVGQSKLEITKDHVHAEVGQALIEATNDEVNVHAKPTGQTKLGNTPTKHAATGEDTLTELNKIKTYLTTMAAVFSSPIPEAGMGSPSSLGTALNVAHNAAKGATIDNLQAPSAQEVFVK